MKVALIADTHVGVRNNNSIFHDYQQRFFDNIFFPYIDDHDIDVVVHVGDHLDNRKTTNVLTSQKFDEMWVQQIISRDMVEHGILGNHTAYYKNTNTVNSLSHIYNKGNGLILYDVEPKEVEIGGLLWGMVPWITADNKEKCFEFIRTTKAEILCGHFEIMGFYMDGGHKCESGVSVSDLKRFRKVFSGHFHKKQTVANISYLGTPYDMTFSDLGEVKGFHIFDTETLDLEFIQNPEKIFHKIYYDDIKDPDVVEKDYSFIKNGFVRLVVLNKSDHGKFDLLLDKLEDAEMYRLQIAETVSEESTESSDVDMSQSTSEIINNHIDGLAGISDPAMVKDIMNVLYTEAMNM